MTDALPLFLGACVALSLLVVTVRANRDEPISAVGSTGHTTANQKGTNAR